MIMPLFGNKGKNKKISSCCRECSCDANSMAKAEKAKNEGAGVKVLGSGCAKCDQLEAATKAALVQLGNRFFTDCRIWRDDHACPCCRRQSCFLW